MRDWHHGQGQYNATSAEDEAASVAFINSVGYWAHYDQRTRDSSWPLPHLESAGALATLGQRAKVLFNTPRVGDLVVVWTPGLARYTRVDLVAEVIRHRKTWVERQKTGVGERQDEVECLTLGAHCRGARAERFLPSSGDRFLRWANLEGQTQYGTPWACAA